MYATGYDSCSFAKISIYMLYEIQCLLFGENVYVKLLILHVIQFVVWFHVERDY